MSPDGLVSGGHGADDDGTIGAVDNAVSYVAGASPFVSLPERRVTVPALAIWSPDDEVLGAVAPLGLAAAAGTAVVVDLDPDGPRYSGEVTTRRAVDPRSTRL